MPQRSQQPQHNERMANVLKDIDRKAARFRELFSTPQGQEVLANLKEEFDPSILCRTHDDNAISITVRAAQRDVIRYIELLINRRQDNG